MIEAVGNLWTYPADVRVITTNGSVRKDGCCVMGRGCALEAKKKYPDLPLMLGQVITSLGNEAFWVLTKDGPVVTFPVKHNWQETADIALIVRSATKIAQMRALEGRLVVMPRPGCGNGKLKWADVKSVLSPILDDRFHVITFVK